MLPESVPPLPTWLGPVVLNNQSSSPPRVQQVGTAPAFSKSSVYGAVKVVHAVVNAKGPTQVEAPLTPQSALT